MEMDENARKAILKLMFGKSAGDAEKHLPILMALWGIKVHNKKKE
jgi:hypothetical protein